MGLILNRSLTSSIDEIWEDCPNDLLGMKICAEGGPVDREQGLLLHGFNDIDDACPLGDRLYAGGSVTQITEAMSTTVNCGPRLFLGHTGWGPEQLEQEIDQGGWLIRDGHPSLLLQSNSQDGLWEELCSSDSLFYQSRHPATKLN